MIKKIKTVIYAIKRYGIKSCLFNAFSILISDIVILSFQKCGKTQLRLMIAKALSLKYNIKKIKLDFQLMTMFRPGIPNILVSQGGSTRDNDKIDFTELFKNKKMIYLVRDPRDIVVSLFHSARTREKTYHEDNISKFIRDPNCGFDKIINFMNIRAKEMKDMEQRKKDFLLIKFEDTKKDPTKQLTRVFDFIGIDMLPHIINQAVEYGSFENMRKMEMTGEINDCRMLPGDVNNPNSYRCRKGKAGTHKEELSKEDIDYVNKEMREKLDPFFGYVAD